MCRTICRVSRYLSGSAILLVLITLGFSAAAMSQGYPNVSVSFTPQNPVISLHEPVVADLTIHNQLTQRATVDLGYNREGNLSCSIVQPNGTAVTTPSPRQREGLSRARQVAIEPGETYRQEVILNKWYPFRRPGSYSMVVSLHTRVREGSGPWTKAEYVQRLTLVIGRRDEKRLVKACAALAQAAMQTNAQTALDAARSLSYVDDLAAIPFLVRLTRQGPFAKVTGNIAKHGMLRIARTEGVEAVVSRLGPEDRSLATEIRAEMASKHSEKPNPR